MIVIEVIALRMLDYIRPLKSQVLLLWVEMMTQTETQHREKGWNLEMFFFNLKLMDFLVFTMAMHGVLSLFWGFFFLLDY